MEFQTIKINDKDVLPLLNEVKFRFGDKTEVYEAMLKCLENLKSKSPDIHKVWHTVVHLLHEHPDLVVVFHNLLPSDVQIQVDFKKKSESNALQNRTCGTKRSLEQVGITPASEQQYCARLKVEDALAYIDQVKMKCDANIYNSFLNIMGNFRHQKLDAPGVVKGVSELLHEHPDLLQSFNQFLPPGHSIYPLQMGVECPEIKQDPRAQASVQEWKNSINYVEQVKQNCDAYTYRSFLVALNAVYHKKLSKRDAMEKILKLLHGHPDLITGFRQFVSDEDEAHLEEMCDIFSARKLDNVENVLKNIKLS